MSATPLFFFQDCLGKKNGVADKKTHVTGQNIQQVHLFRTGGLK